MDDRDLIARACQAAQRAYCPYSHFAVGAALLTFSGDVFCGCNVENASYGLTICAERIALGAAIAAGHREFRAIAIVAPRLALPCGACRQVLAEFAGPAFRVLMATTAQPDDMRILTMADLLPHPFALQDGIEKGTI